MFLLRKDVSGFFHIKKKLTNNNKNTNRNKNKKPLRRINPTKPKKKR